MENTINQRLKDLIKALEMNPRSFSMRIGASDGTTRMYIDRGSKPSSDYLERIVRAIDNIDASWLLTGEGEMFKSKEIQEYPMRGDKRVEDQMIPLFSFEAAAGLTKLFSNTQSVLDYIQIPNLPKCDGAIYISGDSMYPLLKSGDVVMYKQIHDMDQGIFYGEMYLVSLVIDDEDYTLVKYIHKSPNGNDWIKLVSQNKHHDAIDVRRSNVRALGLIKASIRINSMT